MSLLETLGRFRAALKDSREARRDRRLMDSLDPDIQKDIGWPVKPRRTTSPKPWGL